MSLVKSEMFSAIISLIIFHPCHLSPLLGLQWHKTLDLLLGSHRSSLRLWFFFSFWSVSSVVQIGSFLSFCLWIHCFSPLSPLLCFWVHPLKLLFWILYFSGLKFLCGYPLYLLFFCWDFLFLSISLSIYSFVSSMFIFAFQSIFVMAALKSVRCF